MHADRRKWRSFFITWYPTRSSIRLPVGKWYKGIKESDGSVVPLVTVEDTGSGIPAGTGHSRLFEKFWVMEDGHPWDWLALASILSASS